MYTSFHIKVSDLNMNFLNGLKTMFKDKKHISVTVEEEQDETEYLLSSPANKKMLEKAIKNVEKGNVTEVDIDKYLKK